MTAHPESTARLLVSCLKNEGVQYIFGIPGEENIHFIDALRDSSIRCAESSFSLSTKRIIWKSSNNLIHMGNVIEYKGP